MRLFVAITAFTVTACSDGSSLLPDTVGSYDLVTANGKPTPSVVFESSAGKVVVTSATLSLARDKSYFSVVNYSTVLASGALTPSSVSETGKYSLSDESITFVVSSLSKQPPAYSGIITDNELAYTHDGIAYVYRKE
jgi:hypothetical protein